MLKTVLVKCRVKPDAIFVNFALQSHSFFQYHADMRKGEHIIPIDKDRFPSAVAFVETFDTEDDTESENILSFESLREAFGTLRSAESGLSEESATIPERPDYDIDTIINDDMIESDTADLAGDDRLLLTSDGSAVVNARLDSIIEAVLFVGNRDNQPVRADRFIDKLRNVSIDEVEQTITRLNEHYRKRNCPYTIVYESGGYRMVLCPEFESVRANYYGKARETRLSQQAIDTLAVVAYRQPITMEEIQNIRRQSCTAVLNQLVRRNLLRISRETQDNHKSIVRYHTTPRFLELCQITSLDDMPNVDEWDYR